jgi:hypothetical protein
MFTRLRNSPRDVELFWGRGRPVPRDREVVDRGEAMAVVRRALSVPHAVTRLRELLARRTSQDLGRMDDWDVLDLVARYLASGELRAVWSIVLKARRVAFEDKETKDLDDSFVLGPSDEVRTQWTWIEVFLEDEECRPMSGQRCKITLPDGTVNETVTDGGGFARVSNIVNPGQCKITFPDLDQDAWTSDFECPEPRVQPEFTFLEIALVDMEGQPIGYEPFRITLPDGSIHEGQLDGSGRVRYEGLLPGECKVTFPERDTEAWEGADA